MNGNLKSRYSSRANLLYGVPQGSILGPLLFLRYINDLPEAVTSDSLLYTDDTWIVFQHQSQIQIEKQLIRDFPSVCDWFVDIKISIHLDKTKKNQCYLVLNINFEMLSP